MAEHDPMTVLEVEEIARTKLSRNVYNYYASGSDEERAVKNGTEAYNRLFVIQRVLKDVSHVDTSKVLFGTKYPIPIGLAPSAMQKLAGGEGELAVAKAATKLGLNLTLSSQSTTSLEDVAAVHSAGSANGPPFWQQIYISQDPEKCLPLIQRAEAAGYDGLVITVDVPVIGNRLNERKHPLVLPSNLRLPNVSLSSGASEKPSINRQLMDARTAQQAKDIILSADGSIFSSSITWVEMIPWVRSRTSLKIILKGIMSAEDAQLAVEHGADAIVVSNHGGRQLDSSPATIEVLPEIVGAVRGRIPVIVDGGIRRGSDVFKALALGADFVLLGRPVLWGLSYKGQEGVETVLHILERELTRTMTFAGATKIDQIGRSMLGVKRENGFGIARL